jgi:hypothetical protein
VKLALDDVLVGRILAAIQHQAKTDGWRKDGGKFIPHPSTWLNNRRWEDELLDSADRAGLALDRYQPSNGKVAL